MLYFLDTCEGVKIMTVNELLNSMTKGDVFIDDNEIEEVDAGTVKSEVDHWYIEHPYTTGHFFAVMCIYTKPYMEMMKE